jgi:hypothetical protein
MPTLPSSLQTLAPSFDSLQELEIAAEFVSPSDDITWSFHVSQDAILRMSVEPEGQSIEFELADSSSTMRTVTVIPAQSSLLTAYLAPGTYSVSFSFSPALETDDDDDIDQQDCDEPYLRLHFYIKPTTSLVQMTPEELGSSTEGCPDLNDMQESLERFGIVANTQYNYHIKLSTLQETQSQVLKSWPVVIPQPSEQDKTMGHTGLYKLVLTLRKV